MAARVARASSTSVVANGSSRQSAGLLVHHHIPRTPMHTSVRVTTASIAFLASLALVGCAGEAAPTGDSGSTPPAVEVDEGLLTVDLTIARSLLDAQGTMTDEQLVAAAEEKGFAATVDGDTVTYTMTKAQRDDMLDQMRTSAREAADELIADETNSITGIEFDDGMTSYDISVDAARYTQFEALLAVGFYIQGALYQQFTGVSPEEADVTVRFVDDASGEVLNSGSYQEMRANLAG
jgi:hypothetical protein